MSRLDINEDKMYFYDNSDIRHEILNCSYVNYINNNSTVSMHSYDDFSMTIMKHVVCLYQNAQLIFNQKTNSYLLSDYLIISGKIASFLYSKSSPYKVALIGASDELLSFHLAYLLGVFNPHSLLYLIADEPGNDGLSFTFDNLRYIEQKPKISISACGYDSTGLNSEEFDIVVINGMVYYENPYSVLKETVRLLNDSGRVLVYINDNDVLYNILKLFFDDFKEYKITDSRTIICIERVRDNVSDLLIPCNLEKQFEDVNKDTTKIMYDSPDNNAIRSLVKRYDDIASAAVTEKNAEVKIKAIAVKEKLLDYLLNNNPEYSDYYMKKIYECIRLEKNLNSKSSDFSKVDFVNTNEGVELFVNKIVE